MASKFSINKLGFQFTVYGLCEYKLLPKGTPLVEMFYAGGILEKQQDIENTCQFLCKINESWKPGGHYLIMLVIDHLEPKNETSTSITHDDPAMELYLSAKKAVYRISNIIENFDCLVFGQDSLSFVVDWGIIGFSTGSITAEFASSFEPKLSTVILMGCSLDLKKWIPFMIEIIAFKTKTPLSYNFHRSFISGTRSMVFDLRSKKLLVLNKQMDIFAPGSINQASTEELRKMHSGREGHDWKVMTFPGEQHAMDEDYLGNANEWIRKWLVPNDLEIISKI